MKKLTCTLLFAFLAALAASTWTAGAAEISGTHLHRVGNKAAVHHAKAKKAAKKQAKHHKTKHGKMAKG